MRMVLRTTLEPHGRTTVGNSLLNPSVNKLTLCFE
jgi:hypothetical protein